jgi:CubicO group peptidase (beta-lactamase class C family)
MKVTHGVTIRSRIFPIASNIKLFTAIAAGMLAEEGKLDLDKPCKGFYAFIEVQHR